MVCLAIGIEFFLHQPVHRDAFPTTFRQQTVSLCHRLNAPIQPLHKTCQRLCAATGSNHQRLDVRKCVFDSVVKLRQQELVALGSFLARLGSRFNSLEDNVQQRQAQVGRCVGIGRRPR